MEALRAYLKTLTPDQQEAFAVRCGTTIGYLRKAMSKRQELGTEIVIAIERESGGQVRCEDMRPNVDWAYIRGTAPQDTSTTQSAA